MLHLLLLYTVYFRDEWTFVKSRLRCQRKIKLLQIGYYIKFVVGVTFIYSLDLLSEISINLAKLILIIKNMAHKLCKISNILIVTNNIIQNPLLHQCRAKIPKLTINYSTEYFIFILTFPITISQQNMRKK